MDTSTLSLRPAALHDLLRVALSSLTRLRAAWDYTALNASERYMHEASGLDDLERRMRQIERGDSRPLG